MLLGEATAARQAFSFHRSALEPGVVPLQKQRQPHGPWAVHVRGPGGLLCLNTEPNPVAVYGGASQDGDLPGVSLTPQNGPQPCPPSAPGEQSALTETPDPRRLSELRGREDFWRASEG